MLKKPDVAIIFKNLFCYELSLLGNARLFSNTNTPDFPPYTHINEENS